MQDFERLPPHDIAAEQCALGAMMLATTVEDYQRVRAILDPEDFYQMDNRFIFETIIELRLIGNCDAVILRNELDRKGWLTEVGGSEYLGKILGSIPHSAHGVEYAKIVKRTACQRRAISVGNQLIREAYGVDCDVLKMSATAINDLIKMQTGAKKDSIIKLVDAAIRVYERIETGTTDHLIPTGFTDVDAHIGGLIIGGTNIIGARPSQGKSMVAKQIALNVARRQTNVGIVSVEETARKIAQNTISNITMIANNQIARGDIELTQWRAVSDAVQDISLLPIFVEESASTIDQVETAATTLAAIHHCRLIIVDHIHLIETGDNRLYDKVTKVSGRLKALWKRLDVAGLECAQLNRGSETEGRRPSMADLRESGAIDQDGDVIMLLHSEDYYRRKKGDHTRDNKLTVIIAKNKDGPLADVSLLEDYAHQRVTDWTENPAVPEM